MVSANQVIADRYFLCEKIGDGGTAEVFRAKDQHLQRNIALKLLRPQFLGDPTSRSRFAMEARAYATLSHPNIVQVYDFGEGPDGLVFIAMEYIEGRNLKTLLLNRGKLAASELITIVRDICGALSVAHGSGLIHRDIKPHNIMVKRGGRVYLTDFGIVKALADPALTQAGMTYGTAAYMSPEQAKGETVGPASDIYALGCVMYEMLSGTPPFTGDNAATVAYRQVWEQPRPLRELVPEVPVALERIVTRCLDKDPGRRYSTAQALSNELETLNTNFSQPTEAVTISHTERVGAIRSGTSSRIVPKIDLSAEVSQLIPLAIPLATPATMPKNMPDTAYPDLKRKNSSMKAQVAPTPAPPTPPTFQRAPRLQPSLPKGEVEIPAPPYAPTSPSVSLFAVLLPALFAVAALVATITLLNSNLVLALLSFGFMAISSLTSLFSYTSQRRGYKRTVRERQERYRAILKSKSEELARLRDQQQTILEQTDPDPRECLARVERLDRRLWDRAPQDADYLSVRVGIGSQPLTVSVKAPKQDTTIEPDPLVQEAHKIAGEYSQVGDVPILLRLKEAGASGLVGPRQTVLSAVRTLATQLATHHSPDEVKIAAFFPADESDHWAWLRWLPHTWTDDRNHRLLACDKDAAHRLLMSLYDLLNRRLMQQTSSRGQDSGPVLPSIIFFIGDRQLVENEPIWHFLLTQGQAVGAFTVVLADRMEALPKGCRAFLEVSAGKAHLTDIAASSHTPLTLDEVSKEMAERLARTMAPIRLRRMAAPTEIPNTVSLLDVLGAQSVEDLNIEARWQASAAYKSLAAPIGKKAGGELLYLDFHERGHGPHGLAAGATGSGKSELLQSLVASLAVNFHPHQVAFVLIDYKGGGMANAFADLPHLVGTITNLQGNLAGRALAALKSELQRRQTLLAQVGVNHIDNYQKLYQQSSVQEPLPHLIIIADEFAELVTEQPDFMKELISAVRVGRSLGVHLLLATQKPAGVVNEQIWGNARFRICLRVERPEDSKEVLKRDDAASLTQAGRAYFQVGNNEAFDLLQAAWGGAAYGNAQGGSGVDALGSEEIVEIAIDGSRRPLLTASSPRVTQAASAQTQLQAVVAHLCESADQQGIKRLPGPWLQPLPERVVLDDLRPDEGWDGKTWQPTNTWIAPLVGMVDDPVRQYQGALSLNLGKEGHLAIYGAPGSGKTTFIQTLVASLVLTHSPQDVNIYLLDFGGRLLNFFAPLPHVGGVVLTDEAERLNRLLRYLLRELEVRKERFAQAGVNTLASYRSAGARASGGPGTVASADAIAVAGGGVAGSQHASVSADSGPHPSGHPIVAQDTLPAIVVVLDNYTGFANTYPDAEDMLAQVAREGGNLGIHLVVTANSPTVVKSKISGNITLAVALQLADKGDYSMAVGRTGGQELAQIQGRGLVKGKPPLEFQTALPARGDTDAGRTATLRARIEQMSTVWTSARARAVPVLRDIVPLAEILPQGDTWLDLGTDVSASTNGLDVSGGSVPGAPMASRVPIEPGTPLVPLASTTQKFSLGVPIAIDVDDLEPVRIDLNEGQHFLITGPNQSGKTTLLQSWIIALAECFSPQRLQLFLVDFRRAGLLPLRNLPHVHSYIEDDDKLSEVLAEITQLLRERKQALDEARQREDSSFEEQEFIARYPALVIALDDYDRFREQAQASNKDRLEQVVRRERGMGVHLVLAGTTSDVAAASFEGPVKALKELQSGFVLGSSEQEHTQLLNIRLPFGEAGKSFPPGQGYYSHRGKYRKIKVATAHGGAIRLRDWVQRLVQRHSLDVKANNAASSDNH